MADLVLLTQKEVADILRKSESAVARLRANGKLAYIPGRPVLIDRVDLEAYLNAERAAAATKVTARLAERNRPATPEEIALRAKRKFFQHQNRAEVLARARKDAK